jgi:hypothetical protein
MSTEEKALADLHVKIDYGLHRKLKAKLAAQGTTIREWMRAQVERELSEVPYAR